MNKNKHKYVYIFKHAATYTSEYPESYTQLKSIGFFETKDFT